MQQDMSNVDLLGAFERDNFGDILFLQLTQEFLSDRKTTPTAPLGAQSEYRPLGLEVKPLLTGVRGPSPDAVWVVGGEVGGTSLLDAYRMAADKASFEDFSSLSHRGQMRLLGALSGRSPHGSPYLPRMSASHRTMGAQFIVNSVGLSGLDRLVGHRADEGWGAIREADFVSVRDHDSSTVLTKRSVPHLLAPDLVHTLRLTRASWITRSPSTSPYALIHAKGSAITKIGAHRFAEILASAAALRPFSLRLFVAGEASGHDSMELYGEVVAAMSELAPDRPLTIIDKASPLEKAKLIAEAGLWIGTSLHGLIISSSFEVPRVGLELDKLRRYAETWDEPMPVGVPFSELDVAVEAALNTSETPGRANELAHRALESVKAAASVIASDGRPTPGLIDARLRAAKRMKRRNSSPLRSVATRSAEVLRTWRHR